MRTRVCVQFLTERRKIASLFLSENAKLHKCAVCEKMLICKNVGDNIDSTREKRYIQKEKYYE